MPIASDTTPKLPHGLSIMIHDDPDYTEVYGDATAASQDMVESHHTNASMLFINSTVANSKMHEAPIVVNWGFGNLRAEQEEYHRLGIANVETYSKVAMPG